MAAADEPKADSGKPREPTDQSETDQTGPCGVSTSSGQAGAAAVDEQKQKQIGQPSTAGTPQEKPTEPRKEQKPDEPGAPGDGTTRTPAPPEVDDFGLPIHKAEAIAFAASPPKDESKDESKDEAKPKENGGPQEAADADIAARKTELVVAEHTDGDLPAPAPTQEQTEAEAADRADKAQKGYTKDFAKEHARETSTASVELSEFSHQKLVADEKAAAAAAAAGKENVAVDDGEWQTMPAFAPYDLYDDDNRLIAREHVETEEESYGYAGLGGAGKGYTRVLVDDDAESATSMDENTQYLFQQPASTSMMDDEEQQRDTVSQMQATKDLLTEGQRIAYVGITRLHLSNMVKAIESLPDTKRSRTRRAIRIAADSMKMWSQKMMIRLYAHMDISLAEQIMIEQLSEHGVEPKDLTPALMANARVSNPMAEEGDGSIKSPRTAQSPMPQSPPPGVVDDEAVAEPPPPYEEHTGEELPAVRMPSQLPTTAKIDIDLRWTVLCDLFLVLIADSIYDARSRVLLETVGESLDVPWIDICKFERKVTEALEMQQNAETENWDEKDHMEARRKMALRRRYIMMGLATVGGGLVIGLSAGLLAPVIGAGLAAGFTTIGVTGTSSFLAGAGGAAIITSSAAASGSVIGGRAAERRTGAVKTFEYRPLHNNKRVNLIVTVSGWMTGKVDDVRLPFSTVDPVMGDIYSVLWEPEMLTSMGDTINILATEALTQGLQQVLGSTILVSLMAALQLPVVLTKLSYLIDNPWAVSLDRATMAGLILADSLVDRNLGTRPITLVGYSLGSRVIYACLKELARKGAYGLVQNVFLFGSPVVVKRDEFLRARTVVAGRFINGYNRNDWILGYLFRLTNGGIRRVAGLGPVEGVPGMENMDVTDFVVGHMDYRTAMPRLLRECGWLVESDEFTEIEDPDPENHAQRQRELINEIEQARKELEKEGSKPKKGGAFSFFSRKKKGEKQEWEIYDESKRGRGPNGPTGPTGQKTEDAEGRNHGVLFDVDAIRAELAREHQGDGELPEQLQVRELESTLPPMRLDVRAATAPAATAAAWKAPARTWSPAAPTAPTGKTAPVPSGSADLSLPAPARASTRSPFRSPLRSPRTSLPDLGMPDSSSGGGRPFRPPVERSVSATVPAVGAGLAVGTAAGLGFGGSPAVDHALGDNDGISMIFDSSFDDGTMEAGTRPEETDTAPLTAVPLMRLTDPWADAEDDELGKEQEISMTFA